MTLNYKYHSFSIPLCLLRLLKRRLLWVRAAGGIVSAPDGSMLLILRNGRWDLPKGKVEPGETLLLAALREVEEETGIHPLPATSPLPTPQPPALKTYHIFRAPKAWLKGPNPPSRKWHLKQTSWFHMSAPDIPLRGTPQLDEGITAVAWVSPDEWHRRLQSSYGTLRSLSHKLKHQL